MVNERGLFERSLGLGNIVSIAEERDRPVTNPAQLIFHKDNKDFFQKIFGISESETKKMSDFERFSTLLGGLHLAVGSGLYEYICEMLGERRQDDPISLWRELTEEISSGDLSESGRKSDANIFPEPISTESFKEYLSRIFSMSGKNILVDISSLEFKRSDPYHTEKAYLDFLSGREYDKDLLLCGVLYKFCEHFKDSNICLTLYVEDNMENVELLVNYLLGRGVMPIAYIVCSSDCVGCAAEHICGVRENGDGETEILCGIGYRPCDTSISLAEAIKKLATVYPVGKLKLYGSRSNDLLFEVVDKIMKRGLCRAVSELSFCDAEAEAAVSTVLGTANHSNN
ncbi:MAG: hypothetical protein E7641_01335 [Ruminococcaceae bacterium]|nr:hypothetical protein [Oscillospiraceae bacterium]